MNRTPELDTPNESGESAAERSLNHLSALCRGEMAAVETYNMALASPSLARFRSELMHCQRSHQSRVHLLGWRIHLLGGTPPESSGAWGLFAKAVESTASAIGETAALGALEEGEDHGLRDYHARLDRFDADTRDFVHARVMPSQTETHDRVRALILAAAGETTTQS